MLVDVSAKQLPVLDEVALTSERKHSAEKPNAPLNRGILPTADAAAVGGKDVLGGIATTERDQDYDEDDEEDGVQKRPDDLNGSESLPCEDVEYERDENGGVTYQSRVPAVVDVVWVV